MRILFRRREHSRLARGVIFIALATFVLGIAPLRAGGQPKAAAELLVAGASDLRPAFERIGKLFAAETGTKVTFSFGSSGQLAQQIRGGAPFDVFASADVALVDKVVSDGFGDGRTKSTYAYGRLALWVPRNSPETLLSLLSLGDPRVARIAVANPAHAPYGVAAIQSLKTAGIYGRVSKRLVYGENVSDTYRIATSGNAEAALVSLSLVIDNRHNGRYIIVPASMHKPLQQAIVVTAKGSRATTAKKFTELVGSVKGRDIMRAYGFLLPGDPSPPNSNG